MLSTDQVKILIRLKYLFLIPLNDSVCITCIVFHAAVGWHGQLCTSTFALSVNEFMITLILNYLIRQTLAWIWISCTMLFSPSQTRACGCIPELA